MSVVNDATPQNQLDQFKRGVAALTALPDLRLAKEQASADILEDINKCLKTYLRKCKDNPRAPPTKQTMHSAVEALLSSSTNSLSQKWSKPQLATAILCWLAAVGNLNEGESQLECCLKISSGRKGELNPRAIMVEEADGSVSSMSLLSPRRLRRLPTRSIDFDDTGSPMARDIPLSQQHMDLNPFASPQPSMASSASADILGNFSPGALAAILGDDANSQPSSGWLQGRAKMVRSPQTARVLECASQRSPNSLHTLLIGESRIADPDSIARKSASNDDEAIHRDAQRAPSLVCGLIPSS